MTKYVEVLDKGYVRLEHNYTNGDLSVVNAARASYGKHSDELTDKDIRLINFLAKSGHMSPFRHAFVTLEFNAPLMVARQHWKYVVGSDHTMDAWNESSRRYIEDDFEFYFPENFRFKGNTKQSTGPNADKKTSETFRAALIKHVDTSMKMYEEAIKQGITAEQARLFIPAYAMYIKYHWSTSLQGVCHFLNQRLADDAQWEIQQYANAVLKIVEPIFPHSIKALVTLDS